MRKTIVYVVGMCCFLLACQQNDAVPTEAFATTTDASSSLETPQDYNTSTASAGAPSSGTEKASNPENGEVLPAPTPTTDVKALPTKRIRSGNVSFETDNINDSRKFITNLANTSGGYLSNEHQEQFEKRLEFSATVRVPNEQFDAFVEKLESHAVTFETRQISTNDVTEEYADLTTRIKSRKVLLERYTEMLRRTTKTAEIIQIERSINDLQNEIESAEGRTRFIDNRVQYSTLDITCYQAKAGSKRISRESAKGFAWGWEAIQSLFIAITYTWPLWLLLLGAWFWRFSKKNKKA